MWLDLKCLFFFWIQLEHLALLSPYKVEDTFVASPWALLCVGNESNDLIIFAFLDIVFLKNWDVYWTFLACRPLFCFPYLFPYRILTDSVSVAWNNGLLLTNKSNQKITDMCNNFAWISLRWTKEANYKRLYTIM